MSISAGLLQMASMAKLTIIFFAALFIASLLNSSSAIPAIGKRYGKFLFDFV